MAGFERILIICPPHLVPKWKREVEQTVPGVRAAIVESITDLERLRLSIGSGPLFAVIQIRTALDSGRRLERDVDAIVNSVLTLAQIYIKGSRKALP